MREWENQTINIQGCAGLFVENSQTKAEKNCFYFLYCISFKNHFLLPIPPQKKSNIYKNRDISTMRFFFKLTPKPTTSNSGAPHSMKLKFESPPAMGHFMCGSCISLFWKLLCYYSYNSGRSCNQNGQKTLTIGQIRAPFQYEHWNQEL